MGKRKFRLEMMRVKARAFIELLKPYCERVFVAGSIRRQKYWVSDIEIVCVPRYENERINLFDTVPVNQLMRHIKQLADEGKVKARMRSNGKSEIAWLPKHEQGMREGRRFLAMVWDGVPVDLFMVLPDVLDWWGYTLWLRTGSGRANKLMVTSPPKGLRPDGLRFFGGEGLSRS